jgi:hypothetical protein
MADEEILTAPETDQNEQGGDGPGPKSALSEDARKKLDTIVSQMTANKETDDVIKTVVEDFKKKYSTSTVNLPHQDYRSPIRQAVPRESMGQQPVVPKSVPTETTADQFTKKHAEALGVLHNELAGNPDIVPGIIKKQRAKAMADQNLTNFAERPRSDQPLTAPQQDAIAFQPKHPDEPVTPEDVNTFLEGAKTDPTLGRAFLQHVAQNKPDKAKSIQAATYINDAANRLQNEPGGDQKQGKVFQNAQKIAKGELHYDVQSGVLTKPEDVWHSIATELQQKNKAFADYDLFSSASPDQAIQELEKRRSEHDADEPVPVPEGFVGELAGGMAGQPFKGLAAGKVAGGVTALIPGGQEFAPAVDRFVSAAVSSNDFRKMSYAHSLQQNYNQLRNDGLSPEDAYKKANGQAKDESMVDAVAGAAMMYGAGAIGELKLPSFNLSGGYVNAVKTALKQGAKGIGEAGAVGLIQGAGEDVKNQLADAKGIERKGDIGEAIKNGTLFTLGMAIVAKGGSLISGKAKSQVLQGLSKATPEQVDAELGNQILEKHITPEEAVTAKKEIEEHRTLDAGIPENVTEEARAKIQDKIKRRRLLEIQLESADKAFHPEIKEKIKAVNEEILELAKEKVPRGTIDENAIQSPKIEDNEKAQADQAGQILDQSAGTSGEAAPSISVGDMVESQHHEGPRKIVHVSEDGAHAVVEDPGGNHIKHEIPIGEVEPDLLTSKMPEVKKNIFDGLDKDLEKTLIYMEKNGFLKIDCQ